jgi:hypothetical protein
VNSRDVQPFKYRCKGKQGPIYRGFLGEEEVGGQIKFKIVLLLFFYLPFYHSCPPPTTPPNT